MNRGTMGVNSLPKTVTRQRRDCDLKPGPSVPESSTLTTRLPKCQNHHHHVACPMADVAGPTRTLHGRWFCARR